MKKILVSALLLLTASISQATGQEYLPGILQTATRSDIPLNQLSAAATVYTRKDIERLQVKTLPELLNGTPGLDVIETGGYGKTSHVSMRGTGPGQVLVLIDGIKVGSVATATTPFELIPIDQIERVEIIRGSRSSLYGSEALGGVIQIFTRKALDKNTGQPHFEADAGAGSYDTYRVAGTVNGQWQDTGYSLSASQFASQGFNAQDLIGEETDRDGYLNNAVNARLGHRFADNTELEAVFLRSEGKNEFDGIAANKAEFVNQVLGISGSTDLASDWRSTLQLGQSRDDSRYFAPDSSFTDKYNSTRWNASWLNQLRFNQSQLVFGTDYRHEELDSTVQYAKNSRYEIGIFAELHSEIAKDHFINSALRWDKHEDFGDSVTGSLGWRYNWQHGLSFLANFASAFKAPSLSELYYPLFGNRGLKPEESTQFEIGLAGQHDWGSWDIRAYHTDIENLIFFEPSTIRFQNSGTAQIDGIETEIKIDVFGFDTRLSMNLLNPRNTLSNTRLSQRADKTLSLDVSRSFADVDLGLKVLAQDARYDDRLNESATDGYVTLDLRTAYHFTKNWSLNLKLNNALDNKYQTVSTYNTAGRNFFVSVHFSH